MDKVYLSMSIVSIIEEILSKGDRVELIPVKDGVRVIRIQRKEVKKTAPVGGGYY